MDKINRNNYEAYFLDFAEGNLSEEERANVLDFIRANPDLREELEEFEIIELPVDADESVNWSELKKEKDYTQSQKFRDELYFNAIEGDLSGKEDQTLAELLKKPEYAQEFEDWKRLKLTPVNNESDWSDLYQLGLDKQITRENFDHFLIAGTEGLLSDEKQEELKLIAAEIPGGKKELELAKKLRLKTPIGIFYPDKEKLYKKKERAGLLIWFARSAAVAALFILGYFIITEYQTNRDIQIAEQVKTDSTSTKEKSSGEVKNEKTSNTSEKEFEENEALSTGQSVNVKEAQPVTKEIKTNTRKSLKMNKLEAIPPASLETLDSPQFGQVIALRDEKIIEVKDSPQQVEPVKPDYEDYQTLPELAEDYLASRFDYSESNSRGFVPTMAQKIAERAGEAMDAEIKKEENEASDKSKFTFRVGNFKVTRTNSK